MDDGLGDVVAGDLLVEGDRIAGIGRDIAADDAETIDGRGRIVIPGLINAISTLGRRLLLKSGPRASTSMPPDQDGR